MTVAGGDQLRPISTSTRFFYFTTNTQTHTNTHKHTNIHKHAQTQTYTNSSRIWPKSAMIAHQPKVQLDWSSGDVLIPSSFRGHFWQPRTLLSMLCFLFFFWEEEERINGTESSNVHPTTSPSRQGLQGGSPHPPHAMQACHHPPPEPCNSNKEAAKALATAHPNRPSHPPRLLCTFLMNAIWLLAGALANSVMIPLVSVKTCRHSKNDQPRPARRSRALWVTLFLALPGSHECHAISFRSSPPWSTISMQNTHQSGVHCHLGTAMQWETINHDLQSERPPMLLWEVHVALT